MQFREQGKRIKVQAHYECRRHDTSSINQTSPARATLLQSPRWNEGKARSGTLGTHERKVISSSVGAALTVRVLALRWGCAAPPGLNKWGKRLTQGLRPGLCRSIAPLGLTHAYVMCNPKWICGCLVGSGRGKKCRRHDTPAKPRVARVPKARTEPWVYTDRSGLSSVGAALTARICFDETVARSQKEQALVVLLWGFAECGNRKALRLKAQGVYSCK